MQNNRRETEGIKIMISPDAEQRESKLKSKKKKIYRHRNTYSPVFVTKFTDWPDVVEVESSLLMVTALKRSK